MMNVPAVLPENQYVLPGVPESRETPLNENIVKGDNMETPLKENIVKGDNWNSLLDANNPGEDMNSALGLGSAPHQNNNNVSR